MGQVYSYAIKLRFMIQVQGQGFILWFSYEATFYVNIYEMH